MPSVAVPKRQEIRARVTEQREQQGRRLERLDLAGDHYHMHPRTLRRRISDGTIAGYQLIGGRAMYVDLDECDEKLFKQVQAGSGGVGVNRDIWPPGRRQGPGIRHPNGSGAPTNQSDVYSVSRKAGTAELRRARFRERFPELAALQDRNAAYAEGFAFGNAVGYQRGLRDGIAEEITRWNAVMGALRATLRRPTFGELQRRRGEVT
jgi:hypothetical protein